MAPLLDENIYYSAAPDSPSTFYNTKEGKTSRKQVSFSVMSDLYLIPHADDLKRHEREAVYMTKNDFRRIEKENFETLVQMTDGNFPCNKTAYFRGLETLMPTARTKRKQRISFVVNTILREQEKRNTLEPQWLEKFEHKFTAKSAEAAYRKGVWDASEAHRSKTKHKTEVWI